jgi:hypothetical protein
MRKVLYNILTEIDRCKKLVRLIEMCLNQTFYQVCTCKHVLCISYSERFEARRCFITIGFEYAIKEGPRNKEEMELNGTHQLLVYAEVVQK